MKAADHCEVYSTGSPFPPLLPQPITIRSEAYHDITQRHSVNFGCRDRWKTKSGRNVKLFSLEEFHGRCEQRRNSKARKQQTSERISSHIRKVRIL